MSTQQQHGVKRKAGDSGDAAAALIVKAADFAARKHVEQRRKGDGSPYIGHPLGVASIVTSIAGITDTATICAAMLHDTVEDTDATLDELEREFGKEIRDIVADVTDDKSLPKAARKRAQIAHAPKCCDKAKIVKMADKIYNCADLKKVPPKTWSRETIQGYYAWSSAVFGGLRICSSEEYSKGAERLAENFYTVVLAGKFTIGGELWPCLATEGSLDDKVDKYIASL